MKDQLEALVSQMIERGVSFEDAQVEFEKKFISKVLEKNKWNQSRAALVLEIHRNTLSRKLHELGLNHRPRPRNRTKA